MYTNQLSSPTKDAGLDSAKNAPPLISDVEAVETPQFDISLKCETI